MRGAERCNDVCGNGGVVGEVLMRDAMRSEMHVGGLVRGLESGVGFELWHNRGTEVGEASEISDCA